MLSTLQKLFTRDLNKLISELEKYGDENLLWKVDKDIANSAGNLCLHLVGNLNTYIGKELGGTGYIRNRELEFSLKNIPRPELIQMIRETIDVVATTLSKLLPDDLDKKYPIIVFEEEMTTGFFLLHLATHLAYHLGQINYHRRLLAN